MASTLSADMVPLRHVLLLICIHLSPRTSQMATAERKAFTAGVQWRLLILILILSLHILRIRNRIHPKSHMTEAHHQTYRTMPPRWHRQTRFPNNMLSRNARLAFRAIYQLRRSKRNKVTSKNRISLANPHKAYRHSIQHRLHKSTLPTSCKVHQQ